jgi:hypothetical protein
MWTVCYTVCVCEEAANVRSYLSCLIDTKLDRYLLRSLQGRSARVFDINVSALNCYFNFMINHAKKGSNRTYWWVFCVVML